MHVQVLFPSSPTPTQERYQTALALARETYPDLTFLEPPFLPVRDKDEPFGYLAGSDEARARQILTFLSEESSRTVWFGRGGYGLTRTLSTLDRLVEHYPVRSGKRIVGYSDITALFCWCKSKKLPVQLVHCPMLCAFSEQPNPYEIGLALKGRPSPIPLSSSQGHSFTGPVFGGNLAVLASLCGTPWLPIPEADSAVFLEDVGEAPYRIDRFLTQLHDSGFFRNTRKVYLGTYTEHEPAWQVIAVARQRCEELALDLLGELVVGHSEPNYPVFLDCRYRYCEQTNSLHPLSEG